MIRMLYLNDPEILRIHPYGPNSLYTARIRMFKRGRRIRHEEEKAVVLYGLLGLLPIDSAGGLNKFPHLPFLLWYFFIDPVFFIFFEDTTFVKEFCNIQRVDMAGVLEVFGPGNNEIAAIVKDYIWDNVYVFLLFFLIGLGCF